MTTAAGVLSARAAIVRTVKPDNFTVVLLILVHYPIYAAEQSSCCFMPRVTRLYA
jgi:hypothetical protein